MHYLYRYAVLLNRSRVRIIRWWRAICFRTETLTAGFTPANSVPPPLPPHALPLQICRAIESFQGPNHPLVAGYMLPDRDPDSWFYASKFRTAAITASCTTSTDMPCY